MSKIYKHKHIEMIDEFLVHGSSYQFFDNHGTITRCRDCRKRGSLECPVDVGFTWLEFKRADFFCAAGEPKEGEFKSDPSD